MTWYPITHLPIQRVTSAGVPYNGAVLKAYAAGGSTPVNMATDSTGGTTAASFAMNANGDVVNGAAVIIPHIDQNYKLALYPTQAAADANSGAIWTVDNIAIVTVPITDIALSGTLDVSGLATFSAGAVVNNLNGGALAGFRNTIINGAMNIWQRGTGYALATGVAWGSVDRWGGNMASSAAGIMNQSASVPPGFQFSLKVGRTNGSALANTILVGQAIEAANCIPLAGSQVTLSFYAKAGANYSSADNFLSAFLMTGTGTDEGLASCIASSWAGFSSSLSGGAQLTTSFQKFSFTFTIPSNAKELAVIFNYTPSGTAGADDNYYLTGVQLEPGSKATPFEIRPFQQEFYLCLPYYEKSFAYGTTPAQNIGAGISEYYGIAGKAGANPELIPVTFRSRKRAIPTMVTYNPAAANAQVRDTTAAADCSSTTANTLTENSASISATGNGSTAVGNYLGINWTASAEL